MALIRSFIWTRTASPIIYQNLDTGISWVQNSTIPDIPYRNGIYISRSNADHFVVCGSGAGGTEDLIYYSLDNGVTVTQSSITGNLASMASDVKPAVFIEGSRVFVSTLAGLYYSGNSGATFTVLVEYDDPVFDGGTVIPFGERSFTQVYANDNYIIVGISTESTSLLSAKLYLSSDSGLTWIALDDSDIPLPGASSGSNIDGIYCSNDGDNIVAFVSGDSIVKMLSSSDGWTTVNTPISSVAGSIGYTKSLFSVVTDSVMYCALPFSSENNPVYKSTDYGQTWNLQSSGQIPITLNSISFYSETEGFALQFDASISSSRILKSTDSGQTFIPITQDTEFGFTIFGYILAASIECGCPPGYTYDEITNNCTATITAEATNVGGDPYTLEFDSVISYGDQGLQLFPSLALTDLPVALFPASYPNPNGALQSTNTAPYFYKNADFTPSKLIIPLVAAGGDIQGATNSITGDVWKRARNKMWGGVATYANPTNPSDPACTIGNSTARLSLNNISASGWPSVQYSSNQWKNSDSTVTYTGPDDPAFPWLSFTKCITLIQEKEYLIGIAGDNIVALDIDFDNNGSYTNVFQVYNTSSGAQYTFKRWFVIPVTLPAGTHTVRVKGADLGGNFGFGAEIYDIPLQDFINKFVVDVFTADSYTAANGNNTVMTLNCSAAGTAGYSAMFAELQAVTIFSTADYRNVTVYDGGTWTCPAGYELDLCNGVPSCSLTDVVDKVDCSFRLEDCTDQFNIEYTDANTNPTIGDYVGKVLSDDTGCWQVSEATTLEIPTQKDTTNPPLETCFDCVKIYKVYNCDDLLTPLYCTGQDLSEYVDIYSVTLIVNGSAISGCYVIRNEQVLNCDPLLASDVQVVEAFLSCQECLPKVYKLTNCANPNTVIYSNTQTLSEQVGKSITITGYPNICWEVSLELDDVFNTVAVEVTESYKDCECCLQYQCIK